MGGSPDVPGPTPAQEANTQAQTDLAKQQLDVAKDQLAETQKQRDLFSKIYGLNTDADIAKYADLNRQSMELSAKANQLYLDQLSSPLYKKQQEIGMLQADRLEKALKGELPISEATKYQKQLDFERFKEGQARIGNVVIGDSLDNAVAKSSGGQNALEQLKTRYSLLEDAQRRGEIDSGGAMFLNTLQSAQGLTGQASGQFAGAGGQAIGLLSGVTNQGYGTYNNLAQGAGSTLGALSNYYANQQAMVYDSNKAAWGQKVGLINYGIKTVGDTASGGAQIGMLSKAGAF